MTLYIQDGAAIGHYKWAEQAIANSVADGVIISPFSTPMTPRLRHTAALEFADKIHDVGGEVIFDATTHGLSFPATNNFANYNTWNLWSGNLLELSTDAARKSHVEIVFDRQRSLGAHTLTPTIALSNPIGTDADIALNLVAEGRLADSAAWHSLAGRREFWLSPDLDSFVGSLQQFEPPVWFITLIRSNGDYPPDTTETALTAALCRTVDSLSRRSKVIVCHSDLAGLPAIAAGATGLGTGWHSKQRLLSPASFQNAVTDQIRIPAKWFTYFGLAARIHKNESQTLVQQDNARARALYKGAISDVGRDRDQHHLAVIKELISSISSLNPAEKRVAKLRAIYEKATVDLINLAGLYGRGFNVERIKQIDGLYEGLREYAINEGTWGP